LQVYRNFAEIVARQAAEARITGAAQGAIAAVGQGA